jgi:hypothetical protein
MTLGVLLKFSSHRQVPCGLQALCGRHLVRCRSRQALPFEPPLRSRLLSLSLSRQGTFAQLVIVLHWTCQCFHTWTLCRSFLYRNACGCCIIANLMNCRRLAQPGHDLSKMMHRFAYQEDASTVNPREPADFLSGTMSHKTQRRDLRPSPHESPLLCA